MTQQTLTTSFLKHSQPLLTKCLQAALIAAPVMLAAAPSNAAVVGVPVNGFTGLFDQSFWSKSPGHVSNSVTFAPNTGTANSLTISKVNTNTNSASASRDITSSDIDALRPFAGWEFVGWKVTGKYTLSGTGTTTNPQRLSFTGQSNDYVASLNQPTETPTSFTVEGDPSLALPDTIFFDISRINNGTASATGVITDFKFEAFYDVPGPLPIVGAAAAFAWSRKLRNRLKSANTLA